MKKTRSRYFSFIYLSLLIAVSLIAVNSFARREGVFPLDDAYIHWVYAENIARGYGFSFNPGEPSMGTSSPLFVLLGALFIKLGGDYHRCCLLSSTLFFAGSAVLVFYLLKVLLQRRYQKLPVGYRDLAAWMGGLLFATNGNFIWYVLAGMETPLFIFLGLLSIYLYLKRGWDWLTGVALGLLLWTRVTGGSLLLVLLISDLWWKKFNWRGYLVTGFIYTPFILLSLKICGSVLPTNVVAKKLTYVDGELSLNRFFIFLKGIFSYLANLPAYQIALIVIIIWIILFLFLAVRRKRTPVEMEGGLLIILGWGIFHIIIYGLTFRTLLHHLRYLAVIYPVIAIGCTYAFISLSTFKRHFVRFGMGAIVVLILISSWNLNYWSKLYHRNIRHIQNVYLPAALWLKEYTPGTSRVAAFDIGLIKHLSDRYIIDVGGLVDENVHPYLKVHRAGKYIKERGADYIVYSCEPDCDLFTGIYFSEYEGDELLHQKRVASFSTDHYPMPTITHSIRLNIYRVEGWLGKGGGDKAKLFVDNYPRIENFCPHSLGDKVIFLGYNLEPNPVVLCQEMFQSLDLTYFWRIRDELEKVFWVRTEFEDQNGKIIFSKSHIPTHNRYPPPEWGKGEVIKEHHVIWVTPKWKPGEYDISLYLDKEKIRPAYGEAKKVVIGSLRVEDSPLKPVRLKWKKFK